MKHPRTGKSTETGNRLVAAARGEGGEIREWPSLGAISLWGDGNLWN